ncbi:hypothetical protein E4U35_006402 [Claviceps purpurea]|nr:hypothetical protein E4U51_007128 [Claviceps purpurea]KAG6180844.1 hypothetical protein E4U36_004482 [Claviceps purpurea]KAG6198765.1 hypothetical protein E4U10_006245 [Claviceps purpurea]KAG6200052.1 hypothetical protein E4U35_006402 [Claviceps purpurea]KAG6228032.1 hypothetical protein E4U25_007732 [Claviceps purpurea]
MKFSDILGSLVIYGLQVHAFPTDLDPQAIQPIEASSPIPNTLEARDTYCCVALLDRLEPGHDATSFIPRGTGVYTWFVSNDKDCAVLVRRNPKDCTGWTFKAIGCPDYALPDVEVRPASDCSR